jgi:hypothetical protein
MVHRLSNSIESYYHDRTTIDRCSMGAQLAWWSFINPMLDALATEGRKPTLLGDLCILASSLIFPVGARVERAAAAKSKKAGGTSRPPMRCRQHGGRNMDVELEMGAHGAILAFQHPLCLSASLSAPVPAMGLVLYLPMHAPLNAISYRHSSTKEHVDGGHHLYLRVICTLPMTTKHL